MAAEEGKFTCENPIAVAKALRIENAASMPPDQLLEMIQSKFKELGVNTSTPRKPRDTHWMHDPKKHQIVMNMLLKRQNRTLPSDLRNMLRAKWQRLLSNTHKMGMFYDHIKIYREESDLLKLPVHFVEKELHGAQQQPLFSSIMRQHIESGAVMGDIVLDGFEVISDHAEPYIRWPSGPMMVTMIMMRLSGLTIMQDNAHSLDISDLWDCSFEDKDIQKAWQKRARAWPWDSKLLMQAREWKGQTKTDDDRIRESILRDFVGHVYVVQANRLISEYSSVLLEEEMAKEESERQVERDKKRQANKQKKKSAKERAKRKNANDSDSGSRNWENEQRMYQTARRIAAAERNRESSSDARTISTSESAMTHTSTESQENGTALSPALASSSQASGSNGSTSGDGLVNGTASFDTTTSKDGTGGGGGGSGGTRHSKREHKSLNDEWKSFEQVLAEVKRELADRELREGPAEEESE
eukprot:c8843_g1_i1.p1 GENE.c8843_g1_i1~~c8843_g1_i1.p1  ORF type:complete len:471 (-),score=124.41 c8843_g1_i1:56-1468(-)